MKSKKTRFFYKKVTEKFGGITKKPYLCNRNQDKGRLAQLV